MTEVIIKFGRSQKKDQTMLKTSISSLDEIDKKYQVLYSDAGDGTFMLDDELSNYAGGLKSTNQDLKDEKIVLKNRMADLEVEMQTLLTQTRTVETDALLSKESYTEALNLKTTEFEATLKKSQDDLENISRNLITQEIQSLAKEIAGDSYTLMTPHLVGLEFTDGEIVYPNGASRDNFIKSFTDNETFNVLTQSAPTAQGSGASAGSGKSSDDSFNKYFDPTGNSYDTTKQNELQQENPELYTQLETKYGLNDPYNIVKHTVR